MYLHKIADYLFEATERDATHIFVPDAEAVEKFNKNLKKNRSGAIHEPGSYWKDQAENHNNYLKGYEQPAHQRTRLLHQGSQLGVENSAEMKHMQDELEKHVGHTVPLQDFRDMFEITHPYEIHSVGSEIPEEERNMRNGITNHITMNKDALYKHPMFGKTAPVIPDIKRGVLYSRLWNIDKSDDPTASDNPDDPGIRTISDIFHQPLNTNGHPIADPERVGVLTNHIIMPSHGTAHVYFDTLHINPPHRGKKFANAALTQALPLYAKNLNADHVRLYAADKNGLQTWAKMGGVYRKGNENDDKDSLFLTNQFQHHLSTELQKHGKSVEEAEKQATAMLDDLKRSQIQDLMASGKNEKAATTKVEKEGIEPYKIASVKLHTPSGPVHTGFDYLHGKSMNMAIPLHAKSKHGHSFAMVAHRFPGLKPIKEESFTRAFLNMIAEDLHKRELIENQHYDLDDPELGNEHPYHIVYDIHGNKLSDGSPLMQQDTSNMKSRK